MKWGLAMKTMNKCTAMDEKLADLLLEPEAASAKVKTHVAECASCQNELAELRATMGLMDAWTAPEPSPYFMTRLNARVREERNAPRQSWFQRLRARYIYGPQLHAGPLAATALTVMLLIGGGAYLGVTNVEQPAQPAAQSCTICRRSTATRRYWINLRQFLIIRMTRLQMIRTQMIPQRNS